MCCLITPAISWELFLREYINLSSTIKFHQMKLKRRVWFSWKHLEIPITVQNTVNFTGQCWFHKHSPVCTFCRFGWSMDTGSTQERSIEQTPINGFLSLGLKHKWLPLVALPSLSSTSSQQHSTPLPSPSWFPLDVPWESILKWVI